MNDEMAVVESVKHGQMQTVTLQDFYIVEHLLIIVQDCPHTNMY